MSGLSLSSKVAMLPKELQQEVSDFIDRLIEKSPPKEKAIPVFGWLKDKIWMSPDFDEPLEDFKDYM